MRRLRPVLQVHRHRDRRAHDDAGIRLHDLVSRPSGRFGLRRLGQRLVRQVRHPLPAPPAERHVRHLRDAAGHLSRLRLEGMRAAREGRTAGQVAVPQRGRVRGLAPEAEAEDLPEVPGLPTRAPSQEDREGAPAPQGDRASAAAVLTPVQLFVYGTLRPGLARDGLAAPLQALRHLGAARVRGRLLDLGAYPGAVLDAGAAGEIVGELLEVTQAELLAALDAYEGFDPLRPEDSLFVRTEATARCEDGREIRCQIYVYVQARNGAAEVPDGEWRGRGSGKRSAQRAGGERRPLPARASGRCG